MKFKLKTGFMGLCVSLVIITIGAFYPAVSAFPFYSLTPILFPVLQFFPNLIEYVEIYFAFGILSPLFAVVTSFLWFGVGYVIGRLTEKRDRNYIKALTILIFFAVVYLTIGYFLAEFLEERSKPYEIERQQKYQEGISQARIKLWCTEEIGTWALDSKEWKFSGIPKSVRLCDNTYVISESSIEPLEFYLDQRQVFTGVCHATRNPEGCRALSHCSENLCTQFH